jgi:hypothetical protein
VTFYLVDHDGLHGAGKVLIDALKPTSRSRSPKVT